MIASGDADLRRSTADVYRSVLQDYVVLCCAHPAENELGAAAFATGALLAPLPTDRWRRNRLLGLRAALAERCTRPASPFRSGHERLGGQFAALQFENTARVGLHEGYLVDPSAERASDLDPMLMAGPDQVIGATAAAWQRWGSKVQFRRQSRSILGEGAVAPGLELECDRAEQVADWASEYQQCVGGRVIIKLPGIGGQGNLVVDEVQIGAVRGLWGSRDRSGSLPVDAVVERLLTWEESYSVSFLIGGPDEVHPVAVCQQVIDMERACFVGSTNVLSLDDDDLRGLLDHSRRLFEHLSLDGYMGIAALDLIVGSPTGWFGRGLPLPSGRSMLFIECNPRFNRHNRVGVLVERLAEVWSVGSEGLDWSLTDRMPTPGLAETRDLDDSGAFGSTLQGLLEAPEPGDTRRISLLDRGPRVMDLTIRHRPQVSSVARGGSLL